MWRIETKQAEILNGISIWKATFLFRDEREACRYEFE